MLNEIGLPNKDTATYDIADIPILIAQYSCPFIFLIKVKVCFSCAIELMSANHSADICFTNTPPTLINAPTIIAVQAAEVVPLFQYSPPMITAPDPPANMAAVIAKKSAIF